MIAIRFRTAHLTSSASEVSMSALKGVAEASKVGVGVALDKGVGRTPEFLRNDPNFFFAVG
jgi:hypothetical protein